MHNLEQNGSVSLRIIWLFVMIGGKYWVPPLIVLFGIYQLFLAVWTLTRTVNAGDEQ
ncbi:MAG: hypothetical protein AAF456_19430 [Planctomycetota bacterium]